MQLRLVIEFVSCQTLSLDVKVVDADQGCRWTRLLDWCQQRESITVRASGCCGCRKLNGHEGKFCESCAIGKAKRVPPTEEQEMCLQTKGSGVAEPQ